MKNFKARGDNLTVPAPYNMASGEFALVGAALFGAAVCAASIGNPVTLVTEGVFEGAPKVAGAAWAIGDVVYWDATAKAFTATVGANKRVGVVVIAALAGDVLATVLLPGVVQ